MNGRMILVVIVIATAALPANAERVPVTCDQFITSLTDGGKEKYDAPSLTIGKTLAYGDFKDSELTMFPDVYIGLSCLNGQLDSFTVMPETRKPMDVMHAGFTWGIAMHAFGLDWKKALNIRDEMVRVVSKEGRSETRVDGATIRLYMGVTGIPVFQIEYPDPTH